ncbi:hypothetical protein IV203_000086 [Nitzschia inconspicua]|uniref:Uncharacterized protein n=1 Tax=Nitzschia inconspicua TaxID=303405 RepID=A0A9K3L4B9_9STRA|nr:hypothetical protein IV203_000086 [Nitzschia inconspicua]
MDSMVDDTFASMEALHAMQENFPPVAAAATTEAHPAPPVRAPTAASAPLQSETVCISSPISSAHGNTIMSNSPSANTNAAVALPTPPSPKESLPPANPCPILPIAPSTGDRVDYVSVGDARHRRQKVAHNTTENTEASSSPASFLLSSDIEEVFLKKEDAVEYKKEAEETFMKKSDAEDSFMKKSELLNILSEFKEEILSTNASQNESQVKFQILASTVFESTNPELSAEIMEQFHKKCNQQLRR